VLNCKPEPKPTAKPKKLTDDELFEEVLAEALAIKPKPTASPASVPGEETGLPTAKPKLTDDELFEEVLAAALAMSEREEENSFEPKHSLQQTYDPPGEENAVARAAR